MHLNVDQEEEPHGGTGSNEPDRAKEVRSEDEQRRIFHDLAEVAAAYPAAYCVIATLLDLKPQVWECNPYTGEWALVDLGTFDENNRNYFNWKQRMKFESKNKDNVIKPREY